MRTAIVFLCALTAEAFAHGGSFGHGPTRGPPPGIGLLCDCARLECKRCSTKDLARAAQRRVTYERHQQTNDFAFVRCTVAFRAAKAKRPIEAYAVLHPSPLFAPTGGNILQANARLSAVRANSQEARRKYLWTKRRGLDPFLLLRNSPGRYALRAYPVRADYDTVVTIEGVALASPLTRGKPRFYRTEEAWLVVRDLEPDEVVQGDEFHDTAGKRALRFMSGEDARAKYPKVKPTTVPFVRELRRAYYGDRTALVALPPNATMPPPDAKPPTGPELPPGEREPIDPPPPPPEDP